MIAIQFDIWGNVTSISDGNGPWSFKQTFFEDDLLKYEDNLGNYWTKEYGEFPFKLVKYKEIDGIYFGLATRSFNIKTDDDEIIYSLSSYLVFTNTLTIMPTTMASELVPVVPMSTPIGNILYLDYKSKEKWYQKIKSKYYLVMSKIYSIFVTNKLKIL